MSWLCERTPTIRWLINSRQKNASRSRRTPPLRLAALHRRLVAADLLTLGDSCKSQHILNKIQPCIFFSNPSVNAMRILMRVLQGSVMVERGVCVWDVSHAGSMMQCERLRLQKRSVSATPSAGVPSGKLFNGAHHSALNQYSHSAAGYLLNH